MGERDSPKPTAGISAPVLSLNFVAAMFVLQKRVYSLVVCVLDRLSGYRTTGAIQVHTRSSKKKKETHDRPHAARGRWVTRWLYYFPLLLHPPLPLHVLLMLCPPRVFVATLAREPLPQPPPAAGAERTCPSSPCRGGATATGCRRRELPSRNKSRGGAPAKSSHGELRPSLGPLLSAGGGSGLEPGDARNGPPAPLLRLRLLTCVMGDSARLAYVPARVKCL